MRRGKTDNFTKTLSIGKKRGPREPHSVETLKRCAETPVARPSHTEKKNWKKKREKTQHGAVPPETVGVLVRTRGKESSKKGTRKTKPRKVLRKEENASLERERRDNRGERHA